MKKSTHSIPKILDERFDMLQELEAAREIEKNFSKGASQTETEFVRNRIMELEKGLSESEPEAAELLNRLGKRDLVAFTAGWQRYMYGWQWKVIAINHGLSEKHIKAHLYRAMSQEQGEGGT